MNGLMFVQHKVVTFVAVNNPSPSYLVLEALYTVTDFGEYSANSSFMFKARCTRTHTH